MDARAPKSASEAWAETVAFVALVAAVAWVKTRRRR